MYHSSPLLLLLLLLGQAAQLLQVLGFYCSWHPLLTRQYLQLTHTIM
jgi:hypothetical protein